MSRTFLTILSLFIALSIANAQEGSLTYLSLQECMDFAMKHNYTLKNSQLDILIQQVQNNETISAAYPHISAKAESDHYVLPTVSFINAASFPGVPAGTPTTIEAFPFSLNYASSAMVSGNQILFDGSVLVALQARKTVLELAHNNSAVSEANVRYNIFKSYKTLVIAYRQYDIIKSSLGYARSLQHDVEVTRDNGFAEKIDVERATVQVNNLATDSMRISNALILSEQVLKYTIGMDIATPIILTDTSLDDNKQDVTNLLLEEKDYTLVPEYNLMQTNLKLNEYNVRRYKLSALPTVNLFGAYGINNGAETLGDLYKFRNYWSNETYGIQINLPIFNGLMRVNQVREAQLNVEKARNNIENIKQTIDFQEAQARTSLKNARLQLQSQRRNLDLSNDVLDLARRKYKEGVGSNLEVTQAQTDNLSAQNNYFSTLIDLVNAEADLKKALGLLK